MRISDWSSDVCSSDLSATASQTAGMEFTGSRLNTTKIGSSTSTALRVVARPPMRSVLQPPNRLPAKAQQPNSIRRSEEHTSELQSLMRISYAVFCLKKKTQYK